MWRFGLKGQKLALFLIIKSGICVCFWKNVLKTKIKVFLKFECFLLYAILIFF